MGLKTIGKMLEAKKIFEIGSKVQADDQRLLDYLSKGQHPFDYENQLFTQNPEFLKKILNREVTPPIHFEFHPTEKCNNKCVWCRGGHRDDMGSEKELTETSMIKLIGELKEYGLPGLLKFSGISGEPLMNKGTIRAIKSAVDLGLNVGLITNGILLLPQIYDYLKGITYVNISLDAGSREIFNAVKGHNDDTFERILENIRSISKFREEAKENFRITVSYVLCPKNYQDIIEATKRIKETGADMIQFKVPHIPREYGGFNFSKNEIKRIRFLLNKASEYSDDKFRVVLMQKDGERENELNRRLPKPDFPRCYSQFLTGIVGADGNVYTCVYYPYNKEKISGKPMGNIYEKSFKDIWSSGERKKTRCMINPSRHCQFCCRYDHRINQFINYLSKNPALLK